MTEGARILRQGARRFLARILKIQMIMYLFLLGLVVDPSLVRFLPRRSGQ
jgi:hypothetical protein